MKLNPEHKEPKTDTGASFLSLVVPGTVLAGKFQIVRKIGRGGMGLVIEAHHLELDERVALKFLQDTGQDDAVKHQRFYREARAAAKIKSEHVTRVLDVGKLETGQPYMVMEHLSGIDLSKHLKSQGKLPITTAVDYIVQAMDAVAEAHANGIIHRDLKPSNLFLADRPDGTRIVKVLDFGIAKQADGDGSGLTDTALVFGSMVYMSPEQTKSTRDVDERTDIYSLGITLFELCAGRAPFYAKLVPEIMMQKAQGNATPLRELVPSAPAALEKVLQKAFERDLDKRYVSIAAFAQALAPFASEESKHLLTRIARVTEHTSKSFPRSKILPELREFAREIELELGGDSAPEPSPVRAPEWSDEWSDEYSLKEQKSSRGKSHGPPLALVKPSELRPSMIVAEPSSPESSSRPSIAVPPRALGKAVPAASPPLLNADSRTEQAPSTARSPTFPPPPVELIVEPPPPAAPVAPTASMPAEVKASAPLASAQAPVERPRGWSRAKIILLSGSILVGAAVGVYVELRPGEPSAPVELKTNSLEGVASGAPSSPTAPAASSTPAASSAPAASPTPAASPAAIPSADVATPPLAASAPPPAPDRSALRHLCSAGAKAAIGCASGSLAWCDASEQRVACCDPAFVPTGVGEACGCPPGAPLMPKAMAAGCKLAPDAAPLTPTSIDAAFSAKQAELQACFPAPPPEPTKVATAIVVVALELAPDGQVFDAKIQTSSSKSVEAQACVVAVAKGMRFAPPPSRGMKFIHPLRILTAK